MKKKKRILFILIALLTLVYSSCSIDDIKPKHQVNETNVIKDKASAQKVLNGIYVLWNQSFIGSFPIPLAAMGVEGTIQNDTKGYNNNELDPGNSDIHAIYNTLYKVINRSNFLIEKLNEDLPIPQEEKEELIAEGKFNRAYAYFTLLRFFGEFYDLNSTYGVVLRTEFASGIDADPRASVQETYDLILSDLAYAVEKGSTQTPHYYAGNLAAKALLAKVNLYMGNYDVAANLAEEVMHNDQGIILEDHYEEIFQKTFDSEEALFFLYHDADGGGSEMYKVNGTDYSEYLQNLADAQIPGEGNLDGEGEGYDYRFAYAYAEQTKGTNNNGKYLGELFDEGNSLYISRLAENYLIYAEAEARNGNTDNALAALNEVRVRAHVDEKEFTDSKTLLEDIRQEKLLELFFENGEPWFDLIRYHINGDINAFELKESLHSTYQFIMPIPLKALNSNKNLVQNPGY